MRTPSPLKIRARRPIAGVNSPLSVPDFGRVRKWKLATSVRSKTKTLRANPISVIAPAEAIGDDRKRRRDAKASEDQHHDCHRDPGDESREQSGKESFRSAHRPLILHAGRLIHHFIAQARSAQMSQ